MRNIIWILSFEFLVKGICCDHNILSKFHQNGFKLKDVRVELISYDKEIVNYFDIKAFKYNRSITAHNATFNFKVDVKDLVEVVAQVNKFLSNEYRYFPLRVQLNLRKIFDSNAMGLGAIKNCGNLTTFYFYKNITYHICNFIVDETRFPPLIPNGRYRCDSNLMYYNKQIASIYTYGEIYTPIEYPKK